jgi:hypothetical protein
MDYFEGADIRFRMTSDITQSRNQEPEVRGCVSRLELNLPSCAGRRNVEDESQC